MFCRDCGSTVTKSDRFCPACGTPNVLCKFHPKFGPALKIVEPRIVFEPAPVGSPSCPRCHRLMERPQEYCRGCGMDLVTAWDRYERVHVLDAWRQKTRFNAIPYRSTVRLAGSLRAVLTLGIGVASAVGICELWLYTRSEGLFHDGPATTDLLRGLDAITNVAIALFVVGMLLLVWWMRRAYANLPALAVGDLRFKQGWTIAGWIVPGFNLFRPKQLIDDLWRASHPLAPPFSSSWRLSPVPAWSIVWWTSMLLGGSLGVISHLMAPGSATGSAGDRHLSLFLAGAAGLLLAGSAICLQSLVQQITDRQQARAGFVLDPDAYAEELEAAESAATGTDPHLRTFEEQPSLVHSRQTVYGKY